MKMLAKKPFQLSSIFQISLFSVLFFLFLFHPSGAQAEERFFCGQIISTRAHQAGAICDCPGGRWVSMPRGRSTGWCCGWRIDGTCSPTFSGTPPEADIVEGPTNESLDFLNPLRESPHRNTLSTPGGIVTRLLAFIFPAAGLLLFVMLVWGGFEVLMGSVNKKSLDAGKQRITAAIAGFLLLFSSYWIIQIVEYVFGLVIF